VAAFEAEAAAGGASPSHIAAARCLLCSFADEAIAASPWGAQGLWTAQALAPTQLPDPLQLAEQAVADPQAQAPLVELFHVALALGFEGRWGHTAQGKAQLDSLAARLHALLPSRRGRARTARTLSPHWRGMATRGHRDLATLPLWAAVALGGALLLALWLTLNARLDARTRPVFARIAAMPAALQGAATLAATRPRLAAVLPAEAQIDVRDDAQRSLVTLPADSLFVADSARLHAHADALLARVAQALRSAQAQGGEVVVIGHGDDAAPASLQYPTSWHLTRARAQAVADALVARRVAPVRAEGRAEFEPRAANTTPAGRAQNRRIEIELRLHRPEEP
jgi:type VI secretion system protein ImpK